jgi:hypothetical protein
MLTNFIRYALGVTIGLLLGATVFKPVSPASRPLMAPPAMVYPHMQIHKISSHDARKLEFNDVVLLLQNKPCEIESILKDLDAEARDNVKGGTVIVKADGSRYKLCYVGVGDVVYVVDEKGQQAFIDADAFVPATPAPKGSKAI